MKEKHICPICNKEFTGYGNNPRPYLKDGCVCDDCNLKFIIPCRMGLIKPKDMEQ